MILTGQLVEEDGGKPEIAFSDRSNRKVLVAGIDHEKSAIVLTSDLDVGILIFDLVWSYFFNILNNKDPTGPPALVPFNPLTFSD